ncbi:signal peptidase complex subunit 1 [Nematocida parisii]|uniref:Signal peptidase complex subunit 1 n=1 Tax=Nematocida parisii (strain ERTm3) TaxID=935791 RepID=I3EE32_NEMP3|nr:uncharacterized protein NEPG_00081 [Nematocida parisii ERTm1]EIJ87479.1 hypothetical protein NEQG_02360 [Nematocida parisii ERTm3]KAI5127045.1 signal peptidase complex subunit 1 [Nematocida parisii]EIJ94559.1 hypothetical protein NEPG_00081 [Nematocida parisii ERTm1]KAI5127597.1 signal peptidase complex subunit 1 [Nematocida parisii]KAI5141144.1 signal peptidase complex subunit 1 [Nematocida parisii]|eukprot:XP_013057915.1 hypothetical protein NEPG_00081 [Nematocida parisii ERTm1]
MKFISAIQTACNKIDPPVDYIGQHLANRIIHTTLILGIILALISGYIYKDIFIMGYVYVFSSILCLILTVPAWGIFRRNKVCNV